MSILGPPYDLEHIDIEFCLSVGAALWLGKPVILCVHRGAPVPDGLVKCAAGIVEFDEPYDAPSNMVRLKKMLIDLELVGTGEPE